MGLSEYLKVEIVFEQSHLFFPRIINWLLLVMLVLILVFQTIPYLRRIRAGQASLPFIGAPFDYPRFFGTLILTILYFTLMPWVGDFFPNTGLGFLLVSIPYMLALSILYLHQRDFHHLLIAGLSALLAPVIAWYVLARLFNITLP